MTHKLNRLPIAKFVEVSQLMKEMELLEQADDVLALKAALKEAQARATALEQDLRTLLDARQATLRARINALMDGAGSPG